MDILDVDPVVKRYARVTAEDELSFTIEQGEIFALLEPYGAGKPL